MKKKTKWKMLWTCLINFVLVLALAGNASAVDRTWDDGGDPNEMWHLATNWSSDTVPTADDAAIMNITANCLIDSSVTAVCDSLIVGKDGLGTKPSTLTMTGGTLTSDFNIEVGSELDSNGVFIMSGGTASTGAAARMWMGYGSNTSPTNLAYGTLRMTGGELNVGVKFETGKNTSGRCYIYVEGGKLNVAGASADWEFANYGECNLEVTGGDVNVVDNLRLAISGGTANILVTDGNLFCNGDLLFSDTVGNGICNVTVDGGLLTCSEIDMSNPYAYMNITKGEVRIDTDAEETEVRGYIGAGKIEAYSGAGTVIVTPPGGGAGYISLTAREGDANLASLPDPRNYEEVPWTASGPAMSWTAGVQAGSHDVYFGTTETDVNGATNPNSPPGYGNQDPCTFTFPVAPPVLGKTYYWRIDEVNEIAHPDTPWKGDLWQFTIDSFESVEPFEYASTAALQTVWSVSGTGSRSLEDVVVHGGDGSMQYDYTNASSITEASALISALPVDGGDWTVAGIKALTLYFSGDGTNATQPIYVILEDGAGKSAAVTYGDNGEDPEDIKDPDWNEWNIELSDYPAANDVNLKSINKIYIGIGNKTTPSTGSGTVYFDDIRLYPTRCVPAFAPAGDIDGPGDVENDCNVDFIDVNLMVYDWLEVDYNSVGDDGDVNDSAQWYNDSGGRGQVIHFNGTNDWVDLEDRDFSNFHNKTIAFHVKMVDYPQVYRYLFYFTDDDEDDPYRIYFMTRTVGNIRVRFIDTYTQDAFVGTGWHHLALVLEDTADGRCTGKFYLDGTLLGSQTYPGRPRHSGAASGVNIGSSDDASGDFMEGYIDEFRVYDYALNQSEIDWLESDGSSGTQPQDKMLVYYTFNETTGTTAANSSTYVFNHPLHSDAELYDGEATGSKVINFMDYAILAESWLKINQVWP